MIYQTRDGSIIDEHGQVIHFSCDRFVREVCEGSCCFVCGVAPSGHEFNDEHVLPEWVLRRFHLYDRTITLPNDTTFRYDRYVVPCCARCNALLGKELEDPISKLTNQDYEAVCSQIKKEGAQRLFVWLASVFLKTHLKDKQIRFRKDLRESSDPISGMYSWEDLHHIHTVVRSIYMKSEIAPEVLGSFLVLPVRCEGEPESFDFGDMYAAQTLLLRLGSLAFLVVFNDSCGAINCLMPKLERINGAVSGVQLRELMVELAFLNLSLKHRPAYRSAIDSESRSHRIIATVPETCELGVLDKRLRGNLMRYALRHILPSIRVRGLPQDEFLAAVDGGEWTFLFDANGAFIAQTILHTMPASDQQAAT